MKTLPHDYTFCVPTNCDIKDNCMRTKIPETERLLYMADFSSSSPVICTSFIKIKEYTEKEQIKQTMNQSAKFQLIDRVRKLNE